MYFANKTCWITGASSGIGREMALLLAKENAKLILSGSNINLLEEVRGECLIHTNSCFVVPFDLSNPSEVELASRAVLKEHGPIFLLVNNGGISQRALASDTPIEIDRRIMEIDFFSHIIITKTILPGLIENKQGHIAVTSSLAGKFGTRQRSAYASAKHALQGFFESLRIELLEHNIKVTIAYPGYINTPISIRAIDAQGNSHGKMDKGQLNGIPAHICAKKFIDAIKKGKAEVVIAKKEIIMLYLKRFFPSLFFKLISKAI